MNNKFKKGDIVIPKNRDKTYDNSLFEVVDTYRDFKNWGYNIVIVVEIDGSREYVYHSTELELAADNVIINNLSVWLKAFLIQNYTETL